MRGRVLVGVGLLAGGLLLAAAGRLRGEAALDAAAGLLLLAALAAWLSLLPFWPRLRAPPMPGLFQQPTEGQRWCSACGRPAPRGLCPRCRTETRRSRRRRRLQERRLAAQERKP